MASGPFCDGRNMGPVETNCKSVLAPTVGCSGERLRVAWWASPVRPDRGPSDRGEPGWRRLRRRVPAVAPSPTRIRVAVARRNPFRYSRPRRLAQGAEAEPGARVQGRVTIGNGTRLMRGCTVLGNGGPITIGTGSLVARYAVIEAAGGSVHVGDRTSIGDFSNLWGQGELAVGDDVLMASGVRLLTAEHDFGDPDILIHRQGERIAPTTIGDGAWLAVNVVVLAGVTVGAGAVCAAGAVVTKDVPPGAVVAGVPARVIKFRPGFPFE